MSQILKVKARQVLDSRGNPTVEAVVSTNKGEFTGIAPSGASTGSYEAVELRDNGKSFHGKSVMKAVENVNKLIAPKLIGKNPVNQNELDELMIKLDGTKNKSKLGANAIIAVSIALARAGAKEKNIFLFRHLNELSNQIKTCVPVPSANIINGGKHAGGKLKAQEFMIAPVNAKSFTEGTQMISEVYHELKSILKKKYGNSAANVGDEGGFTPPIDTTSEAIEMILKAVNAMGYEKEIKIYLDPAASEFFNKEKYELDEKKFSSDELVDFYLDLIKTYPVASIEDPFHEDDWNAFAELTKKSGIQIMGDDLLVTNPERIKKAIKLNACNALLLKVNQIGTITEAIEAFNLTKNAGWNTMVSHRSGETEDSFIADLSVGLNCRQIKLGAPCRGERTAKYNQLLRIEEELTEQGKPLYCGLHCNEKGKPPYCGIK
ncbi:MAG: phosphopyruvate hydratase [Candidatus Diapherotrites archaeon]|nr:phosphopyruvate hydratase [Candidatus Diapherotrites archaeon]